jgi:hypothetical protein
MNRDQALRDRLRTHRSKRWSLRLWSRCRKTARTEQPSDGHLENFKFSKDPQFVEKVRDIVGLYMNPPDRTIVLCVDEKSQVQALNRTQPILPLAPACQPDTHMSIWRYSRYWPTWRNRNLG